MYGIDLHDPAIRGRSWHWLRTRIRALLNLPPSYVVGPDGTVVPVQQTRFGHALYPPPFKTREKG